MALVCKVMHWRLRAWLGWRFETNFLKVRMRVVNVKVDFISDVACPWCAIGLGALEQAIARLGDEVRVQVLFHPFELNPQMPPGGQDATEYLAHKYGVTAAQQAATRQMQCERAAEVGVVFRPEGRGRIYNTFDAHRLLYWAGQEDAAVAADEQAAQGRQHALKKALLNAYFGQGLPPESHEVLLRLASQVGLDEPRAAAILASTDYADEVRTQQAVHAQAGFHSVPTLILNDAYLFSGAQPVDVFESALRQAAETAAAD